MAFALRGEVPCAVAQPDALVVQGSRFSIQTLKNGAVAYSNRRGVWQNIPVQFQNWQYTQVAVGQSAYMTVTAPQDGEVYAASALLNMKEEGWERVPDLQLTYTDNQQAPVPVYKHTLKAGEPLKVASPNSFSWNGILVLAPRLRGESTSPPVELQVPNPKKTEEMKALIAGLNFPALLEAGLAWQKEQPGAADGYYYEALAHYYLGEIPEAKNAWFKMRQVAPADFDKVALGDMPVMAGRTDRVIAHVPDLKPGVMVESDLSLESKKWRSKAAELLAAGNYDEIEKIDQELSQSQAAAADGRWHVSFFETGLEAKDTRQEPVTDESWQENHDRIAQWNQAKPDSVLAKLMLANSWLQGAWIARGDDYAVKAPEEFANRMKKASPIYKALEAQPAKSPSLFKALLTWSYLNARSLAEPERIFQQGITAHPNAFDLYAIKAYYLLPRWRGQPGDWEIFATQSADQVGGDSGDILYARLVWAQANLFIQGRDNVWEQSSADWPRTQRGFELILKQSPQSLSMATRLFYLALQKQDWPVALGALQTHIGNRADDSLWQGVGFFGMSRMTVIENAFPKTGPNDFRKKK